MLRKHGTAPPRPGPARCAGCAAGRRTAMGDSPSACKPADGPPPTALDGPGLCDRIRNLQAVRFSFRPRPGASCRMPWQPAQRAGPGRGGPARLLRSPLRVLCASACSPVKPIYALTGFKLGTTLVFLGRPGGRLMISGNPSGRTTWPPLALISLMARSNALVLYLPWTKAASRSW